MLHSQGPHQGRIGFDYNVMLLAERGDLRSGVEGMHFDLIDGWKNTGLGCHQFLKLDTVSLSFVLTLHIVMGAPYVFDTIITDAARLDFAIGNSILDRLPRSESRSFSTVRTVQEEEVDVPQSTLLHRAFDGCACGIIGAIGCKLGCEVEVFPSKL